MCGIAGAVAFDRPGHAWAPVLRQVRARLRHRGPDGEGEAFASHVALAHTLLAMTDASCRQPLASDDGRFSLVYNGELFNHNELRAELGGPWRTVSDTETLLAAFRRWGPACVDHLDGMFAFFVWDEQRQEGFAARDRLGVKPLAYLDAPGLPFAFASEAQALLPMLPGRPHANLDAIVEHLVAPAFSGVDRSPFAAIRYLAPGHAMTIRRDGITTQPYWSWQPSTEGVGASDSDGQRATMAAALHSAVAKAVTGALRSSQPLGIFLSGGLDSAAIASLVHATGARPPAFTITFDGQEAWDDTRSALVVSNDTPFARSLATELAFPHREVRFDRSNLEYELAQLARVNDAIPAWEQELSQRTLACAAAREVKGVLVGDAADETHFGYHFLLDDAATSDPAVILDRLGSVPVRAEADPNPAARLVQRYRALIEDAGGSFSTKSARVTSITHLIVRRWLPRLLHNGDIHCMAFGLEPRVPFASSSILACALRVSPEIGLQGGVEKSLLRSAMRGVVPEAIRLRRKSALPKDQDVGAAYQRVVGRILADPHPLVRTLVDFAPVQMLLNKPHLKLSEGERAQLFRVATLHHWAVAHGVAAP